MPPMSQQHETPHHLGLLGIAVVVVVHVDDDDTIHIISMRQASKNEQKTYFANL